MFFSMLHDCSNEYVYIDCYVSEHPGVEIQF